jgi:hypothetical protein
MKIHEWLLAVFIVIVMAWIGNSDFDSAQYIYEEVRK